MGSLLWTGPHASGTTLHTTSVGACVARHRASSVIPQQERFMSATLSATLAQQKFEKIMPEFPLSDVSAGVAYYRDVLGFSVNYRMEGFAVMDRDRARILLITKTGQHKGIASCYVYVADADALYAELVHKNANVEAEPVSRPWGLREFRVFDPEGNVLTLGQPFE
jgi:uncharacterized glyoxalase superfamily protein PhnB